MRAQLFDGGIVHLDPITPLDGGSWESDGTWTGDDEPRAWGRDLLKFFYEKTLAHPAPVVLDIGASTGSYALLPALHPGMVVHAFEPNLDALDILRRNVDTNRLTDRVFLHFVALWEGKMRKLLKIPTSHQGMTTLGAPLRFTDYHECYVWTDALDSYNLAPDYVKIDAEGAELFILRGGALTLRAHRPAMLIECDARNTHQFDYEPVAILELLESWGVCWEFVGEADLWVTW